VVDPGHISEHTPMGAPARETSSTIEDRTDGAKDSLKATLWGNPLWRPVWGLWPDRRFLTSPALALLVLLFLMLTVNWWSRDWLRGLWFTPVTAERRRAYRLLILWRGLGLQSVLLVFGLLLLWRSARRGLAASMCRFPLRARHLIAVVLVPIAAVWGLSELWGWIQSIILARHLAGTGESLLWILRRPGKITFLTDPGPPMTVVLSHNIITGAIALLGYVIYALWWAWILVLLAAWRRGLGQSLLGLLLVGLVCLLVSAGLQWMQDVIPLTHPLAAWMFPPATAAYASWRHELLTPWQHLVLYASMHFAILMVEVGLVEVLKAALERTESHLHLTIVEGDTPGAAG
jgi:hypothetical protein